MIQRKRARVAVKKAKIEKSRAEAADYPKLLMQVGVGSYQGRPPGGGGGGGDGTCLELETEVHDVPLQLSAAHMTVERVASQACGKRCTERPSPLLVVTQGLLPHPCGSPPPPRRPPAPLQRLKEQRERRSESLAKKRAVRMASQASRDAQS